MQSTVAALALVILAHAAGAGSGLKQAEELFKRKDYERAKTELASDTTSLEGNALEKALLMLAGLETNAARAETLYRRVMASPNARTAEKARVELAKIRYAAGDYRTALETLSGARAQGADRDREEAVYLTALCCQQLGDSARARLQFAAITRGSYYSWANLARADIDIREGKIAQAIARYEEIERSRPDPIALFKLGECYEIIGQKDKALSLYRDLVERFPQSLEAGKGKEKIQLLAQPRAKADNAKSAEGGDAGEQPRKGARAGAAVERGYTLQFGSFSARDNALAVAGKLQKLLPGVRVESVEMEGRIWHRVRAGFYESREEAEKNLSRAQERSGLAGTVIPLKER